MTFIPCVLKSLPKNQHIAAAKKALDLNPSNLPRTAAIIQPAPAKLAVLVGKRWPSSGVKLTVSFLDNPPQETRQKIVWHMNAWAATANVQFSPTDDRDHADVRIARGPDGYWSYLGTDIHLIPPGEPTMNLQDFSSSTPESEYYRVVRHETGHTLGFPHEHMRYTIVKRIDEKKAIYYFGATQGWTAQEVREQVLTPLERVKIKGSYRVDETSIMCYRLPGEITKSGRPIVGGSDITGADYKFAASIYPKPK